MSDVLYDITDDVKRDVLAATDLVALIGAVTGLKKAGRSWKGLCPFHGEKTPSFHVHPEKGFYYCFGCGAKGDAITFVRETERLEFAEAVAYLARRAGVALPVRRSGTRVDRAKETRVAEALAAAAGFFREVLPRHAAAVALVSKRGLTVEEAASFGIGAAPEAWDGLKSSLAPRISEETLIEAGLLQRHPDTGRVYDRFRNRLTFEIRDGRGEVLGFGARALGEDPPKYLNTPETNRFTKGKLLYGLDRAKEAIRKEETALLVEGYFDRIACARAGRENAVASMGTALTPAQADLLARHAATVIVAYDGDAAGLAASYKAFPLLLSRGAAVKHLAFSAGHDPDSFLLENGAEALRNAVDTAPALVPALLSRIPGAGSDPDARAARLNEAVEIVSQARDTVLRHELLSALSRGTGVPMAVLAGKQATGPAPSPAQPPKGDPFHGIPVMERKALCILLLEGDLGADLVRRVPDEIFSHPVANEIFRTLKTRSEKGLTLDFSEVQPHLEAVAGQVAARLFLEGPEPASANQQREDERGLARLHKPLLLLKIRQLTLRLESLTREVAEAAAKGDVARRDALQIEKSRVSAERRRLDSESRQT
ncbi:MAG TPA: DNA primase [Thermoanaerobaculia bacterium]|nr:DNA primase [Thermoanaerobaculia bacterium]